MTQRLINAKEAETFIPDLDDFVGDSPALEYFRSHAKSPPEGDANVLIRGAPGSGKTALIISCIRKKLNNPKLFDGDFEESIVASQDPSLTEHEARLFQTKAEGKIYVFVRIDGGTDTKARLEDKIQDVIWCVGDHKFVLLDEAGELFHRGLEESLRPMLTHPRITTYATAQNFHSKRKTDSKHEEADRLQAFLRRFSEDFTMLNPTPNELARLLIRRLKLWSIELDHPDTLRLLIQKSSGVVGLALRPVYRAIARSNRTLTRELVESGDADPLYY